MEKSGLHVLLIEDNPGDAKLTSLMLKECTSQTFRLTQVSRLEEGLKSLRTGKFDIVLLDLNLPDSYGLDGLERITSANPGVPVILLTSLDDENIGVQAVQKNAGDYLVKGQIDSCLLVRSIQYTIERKKKEVELKQAQEALQDASRRKDEFLAMLAHELRNPLAPIRNAAHILRLIDPGEPRLQRQREIIDRQVAHMARLLDDLLDVSRLTSGKIELHRQALSVREILTQAVEIVNPMIVALGHTLHLSPFDPGLRVEGDLDRLTQVVSNLLTNAAKYTDPGGQIWLEAGREDGAIAIRVRDTGIGIAQDMLTDVFDLFTQAARPLDRGQGGLGIGLTVVRNLVQLHGGSVQAQSRGLGKGSEFLVLLPALPDAVPAAASAVEPTGEKKSNARRILIVDDVADTAASLAEVVSLWGHQVLTAHDGPSAVEAARTFRPDTVLLDIGLPGLDGYEVAKVILRESRSSIHIIATTGYGQEADLQNARLAGIHHCLVKPVDLKMLQELLA